MDFYWSLALQNQGASHLPPNTPASALARLLFPEGPIEKVRLTPQQCRTLALAAQHIQPHELVDERACTEIGLFLRAECDGRAKRVDDRKGSGAKARKR